jgi:hypothetical protein
MEQFPARHDAPLLRRQRHPPALGVLNMARYILIDNASGYVCGDTANLPGGARDETPIAAAQRFDKSIKEFERFYLPVGRQDLASNEPGYHVYRAKAIAVITDG